MYQNPTQAIMLQGWSTFHWPKNEHEYIILFSGLPYFQVHRPNSVSCKLSAGNRCPLHLRRSFNCCAQNA